MEWVEFLFLCGYLFSVYLSQRNVQLASSLEGVVSTAPQLAYRLLASPSKHSNPQYQGSHGTVGSKPINDHMFRYLYRLISVSEIKHWTILVYRISVQNQCQASLQITPYGYPHPIDACPNGLFDQIKLRDPIRSFTVLHFWRWGQIAHRQLVPLWTWIWCIYYLLGNCNSIFVRKGLAGGLIINLSSTSVLLDVLGPRSSMCFYQGVAHIPTMTDVLAVKGTVDLFEKKMREKHLFCI